MYYLGLVPRSDSDNIVSFIDNWFNNYKIDISSI